MALDNASPEGSGNQRFVFTVNGERYDTRDQIEEGRDLLQKAGLDPAGDHVLIQLTRPGSKSIGQEDEVDLGESGREEFRAFLSDRTFNFIGDDRGYEWGAASISEADLRDIMGAEANEILVLERENEPDQEIEPGSNVDLDARGTERVRTRRRRITIIVNARQEAIDGDTVTYAQLVALAFQPVPTGPEVLFTITYSKGPKENPKGTLPEGGSVSIKNGMIFVVTQTNRS